MVPRIDGWTTVLAGHWNRMIFTPAWVGQHLFPGDVEVETLVAILPVFPLVYQDAHVVVQVASPRIVLHARQLTDENLERSERMAHIILTELNDTPLIGVGMNFEFVENAPPKRVLDLFDIQDNVTLAENGWQIHERKFVRKIQHDDLTLNLSLTLKDAAVHFEFNFHTETNDNAVALQAVTNKILTLRDTATQLLANTYNLQLENGEHHE